MDDRWEKISSLAPSWKLSPKKNISINAHIHFQWNRRTRDVLVLGRLRWHRRSRTDTFVVDKTKIKREKSVESNTTTAYFEFRFHVEHVRRSFSDLRWLKWNAERKQNEILVDLSPADSLSFVSYQCKCLCVRMAVNRRRCSISVSNSEATDKRKAPTIAYLSEKIEWKKLDDSKWWWPHESWTCSSSHREKTETETSNENDFGKCVVRVQAKWSTRKWEFMSFNKANQKLIISSVAP